jgi:predicted nucleic acid-binding Zn ribbon protein
MEKIPQHKHCVECGKAFIGDSRYCSEECKQKGEKRLKARKRNLIVLYVITLIILTLAVAIMAI